MTVAPVAAPAGAAARVAAAAAAPVVVRAPAKAGSQRSAAPRPGRREDLSADVQPSTAVRGPR